MSANWYYSKDGRTKVGPFPFERLKGLLTEGMLKPDDMVWNEGGPKWVQARMVPGLLPYVPLDGTAPQQTPMAEPDPEIASVLRQFAQDVNLLLDHGEPVAAVVQWLVARGFKDLSLFFMRVVLADRLARAAALPSSLLQKELSKIIHNLHQFVIVLQDSRTPGPAVIQHLLEMGLDDKAANSIVEGAVVERMWQRRRRIVAGIGSAIVYFLPVFLVSGLLWSWQVGLAVGAMAGLYAGISGFIERKLYVWVFHIKQD